MARATPQSLTNAERELLASTERGELRRLGEDELADLLIRVRRARDKAVGIHRREVAAQVGEHGARGVASLPPRRDASKSELFEDALARTSTALGTAARHSAKELRDERLAASRGEAAAATPPANRRGAAAAQDTGRGRAAPPTSKAVASSTLATGPSVRPSATASADRDADDRRPLRRHPRGSLPRPPALAELHDPAQPR